MLVVNVGLEGIMAGALYAPFNLTFEKSLGSATRGFHWLLLVWSELFHPCCCDHYLPCKPCCEWYSAELASASSGDFPVKAIYNKGQTDNIQRSFGKFNFPVLSDIPVLGDIFFKHKLGWLSRHCFLSLAWFVMFKTKFDCVFVQSESIRRQQIPWGINVYLMRCGVMISGLLGGIGGAIFMLSQSLLILLWQLS